MTDAGVEGDVDLREIRSDAEAAGLNCRVYRRRDGRISPTPDPLDLREALAMVTTRGAVRP